MISEKPSNFIATLVTAISDCSLYTVSHPAVKELSQKVLNLSGKLFTDGAFSITLLGGNMLFNDSPVGEEGLHIDTLKKKMRKKGIEKIIITNGVTVDELLRLISSMAAIEETCVSSDHIRVGTVQVKLRASGDDAASLMEENVATVREVYQEFSRFKKLDMVSIENAVLGFIMALKREAKVLRIKSQVKSYSEYTYVHASNVSVLSVFQAEALGLKGEILYEIGIAGLLHDVGKMFVSKDILDKNTGLSHDEWEIMKRHPVYGATYLSTLQDAPKVAVLAAFEHHMKFDGSGYPDTRKRGKKQHLVSQILAVADFFDALRTERPYRKAVSMETIIKLMKDISGKDLNPLLVDNFVAALTALKRIESI
ncbi:MAG TPA: hypothetical protein DCP92_08720 [Nitrospiraceae bacterium]|jgi:HD-GYP domain-containing protein (c-di-GMP phosphodiesterase class II)|nr:hypothetical protein [Nitrospiraceae bacterium]